MWQVFVWVPTKGWKFVRNFKDQQPAIAVALQFVPLEVKLVSPEGREWKSGHAWVPINGDTELTQIEQLKEKYDNEAQEALYGVTRPDVYMGKR